jgi:hypothetical protein
MIFFIFNAQKPLSETLDLQIIGIMRVRKCMNCFQHDFVVQNAKLLLIFGF